MKHSLSGLAAATLLAALSAGHAGAAPTQARNIPALILHKPHSNAVQLKNSIVGTWKVSYDGGVHNTFTGTFEVTYYDLNGNIVFQHDGTLTGTRIASH